MSYIDQDGWEVEHPRKPYCFSRSHFKKRFSLNKVYRMNIVPKQYVITPVPHITFYHVYR